MELRAGRPEDAEGIARVVVSAWKDTYRGLMPEAMLDHLSVEERTERWRTRLGDENDPYHRTLIAESNGMIVGFASYGNNLEGDPEYRGEIYALYILKEFRGQGLGRRLVCRSASALLGMNLTSMIIRVLSKNPYRVFYEQLGGKLLYEKPGPVSGVFLDKACYGWEDLTSLTAMHE